MSKKTSVIKSTERIGGISGKGAYTYNEVGSGERCMPSNSGKLTSARGKMSAAHGTNGQSKDNNMNQNAKDAVGAYCRTFRSGPISEAGYKGGATAHGKQPSGHKDKA